MTTLRAAVSIFGTPEVLIENDAGHVLARRATWRQAEAWRDGWEAARRPTREEPALGLEELAAELERMSKGR